MTVSNRSSARPLQDFPIVIVGTGFSGIAMAVQLKEAGIESFVMLEKASDVGGTWRDNTYPGAACDIPSHLYSFSFEPKADWSRTYPLQEEIHAYLRHCIDKYDLRRHIRFDSVVEGAAFDEGTGTWEVKVAGQPAISARALVLGNGALSIPAYPDIPGMNEFSGKAFHSAKWDHAFDMAGKRVAVIGTGASAIQIVPAIAEVPSKLLVFQRTPPWILPKADRPIKESEKRRLQALPAAAFLYRAYLYWLHEVRALGFVVNPKLMKHAEEVARKYLKRSVVSPELREKLTPQYAMGCKRILLSNDYYAALQRRNVELVTDGIVRITKHSVVTRGGEEHPVDAIVYGTGFSATEYLAPLSIQGRGGIDLNATLEERVETCFGVTTNGFPNLFLLMGPNTGLGHNSMVFMIEAQARYALQGIQALRRRGLSSLDVRADVQKRLTARIQRRLQRSIWASGCSSWYLKDGQNSTLWPGFTFEYWWATRTLRLSDYHQVPCAGEGPVVDAGLSAVLGGARPSSP